MTKTMEQAAWHKGKRPLVDEYLQNAKQVEAVVSGRGHLYRPGFLGEMVTDVERGFKFKLSDLNYNITKEAIERELAQTGHDYDDAYKTAAIAWELEINVRSLSRGVGHRPCRGRFWRKASLLA